MLIKHQSFHFQVGKHFPALYILIGQEPFLINRVSDAIKKAWRQTHDQDCDETILDIDSPNQWFQLIDQANSYSLFSQSVLLDIRYDRKTLEAQGKSFFETYLKNNNPSCLLIIRAPNLTQKQLQSLTNHALAVIVQTKCPDKQAILLWIKEQFNQHTIRFEQTIPATIEQYTRGNLLACSQLIEKIILIHQTGEELSLALVKEHLFDQSEYQLFELSQACLVGQASQALVILHHAMQNRVEPTLILWVLTQEVRYLLQLMSLSKQNVSFQAAIAQLKIWPQRAGIYQSALKKHTMEGLSKLLQLCSTMDNFIKTSQTEHLWRSFELLIVALSSGKQVGYFG